MDSLHAIDASRQLFEQMPVAIAIFDGEMRYRAVSRRHLSDLAWLFSTEVLPPDQVIGRTFREISPDMPARWEDVHDRVLAGEELGQEEDLVPRKDGRAEWVRWHMSPWRDVHGRIGGASLITELVTEQVEIRHALYESEARFRVTFENAPVGIAHLSLDFRWLRVNGAFCRIHGYTADELTTRSLRDIVPPDDFADLVARSEPMRAGTVDRFETDRRALRKDGTIAWVRVSVSCLRKSDGTADYLVVVAEDITARKRTEEELADSEARFRATFENIAVGITHIARDGKYLRFNKAFSRLLDWPADELFTKSAWEVTHPDDLAFELGQLKKLEDGRIDSYSLDKRFLRKDGKTLWVRLTRSCVRKSDGSADYFVAVVEDITARKRAEKELRKSEERFRSSILLSPAPTILFDDREQILAVSQSWLAAAGISARELHKMEDWTIRAHGTRSDEILKLIREIIATEPVARPDELTVFTSSGDERLWNFVTSGLGTLSDGRLLFVSVAEDVTDRRAYEERIHLLMREARHRTKNILGLVQAIARQTAAGGDTPDFIGRFTERIQALAANQDLLVRHEFQRIDVKDLVQVQLAHFADVIGTRIKFDGPKLHLNAAAAQAIGLALHELATNAGKYGALSTGAGGVDVSWQIDDDTFAMSWIERNGPPVRPPEHRGFGSTVTESMVKRTLGGDVQLDYAPSGLKWCLTCHAANALEGTAKPVSTSSDAPSPANPSPR